MVSLSKWNEAPRLGRIVTGSAGLQGGGWAEPPAYALGKVARNRIDSYPRFFFTLDFFKDEVQPGTCDTQKLDRIRRMVILTARCAGLLEEPSRSLQYPNEPSLFRFLSSMKAAGILNRSTSAWYPAKFISSASSKGASLLTVSMGTTEQGREADPHNAQSGIWAGTYIFSLVEVCAVSRLF
jgi:hypothetical protein